MSTQCPLCNSEDHTIVYGHLKQYPGQEIVRCKQCRHIYTFSKNKPDENKIYSEGAYKVGGNKRSVFDKILNWEYKKMIRRIDDLKPTRGNLLDFGCGKGKFLLVAQNNGWTVKGVETAKDRADYARKNYGLDVESSFYSSGKISATGFDVITLFHVLEHLPAPKTLLAELIKSNLTKNGLVVIEVPNIKSWQAKIAGRHWLHLDPPRHISHFTVTELENIGEEAGLDLVRTASFSFHLGVLGMTDSLLKIFGHRKNIIEQLKSKKSFLLLTAIAFLFPFALILETFASLSQRGGISRKYFLLKN